MKTSLFLLAIVFTIALFGQAPEKTQPDLLILPLRVHLVTGTEMIREVKDSEGTLHQTPMEVTLSIEETAAIMKQVNDIWAPSGIRWETDLAAGGGGITKEQAGGGKLSNERLQSLAKQVVERQRGTDANAKLMRNVFPALADPSKNESITDAGKLIRSQATMYHLYLFPYVGQTIQGTALLSGTFAVVGTHSDKKPNRKGYPQKRPLLIPEDPQGKLLPKNYPAAGALSSTIAHELGHNLSLLHVNEGMNDNLMKGRVKIRLGPIQTAKARKQALKGPRLLSSLAKDS